MKILPVLDDCLRDCAAFQANQISLQVLQLTNDKPNESMNFTQTTPRANNGHWCWKGPLQFI